MNEINIIEMNNHYTYDEISKIIKKAYSIHDNNGFHLNTSDLDENGLNNRVGENGKTFIALHNDKIVGTGSVRFVERNKWYKKGIMPDYILAAVLPEYQGQHINKKISEAVFQFVKEKGYNLVELDTASNNKNAINIYKHYGFQLVDFRAFKNTDHYSVVMVKWLDKCPYTKLYCLIRYYIKKAYIIFRYKKGHKKRFGV